jgi:DNA helicase-2/ATP-dependent DNA helicase PcrA
MDGEAARVPPSPPPRASPPARGEPTVDYSFDQRAEVGRGFPRGARVAHRAFGEGSVVASEGSGPGAKVTVFFDSIGEKRVLAQYLSRAG